MFTKLACRLGGTQTLAMDVGITGSVRLVVSSTDLRV
jgi:hypothetical protein